MYVLTTRTPHPQPLPNIINVCLYHRLMHGELEALAVPLATGGGAEEKTYPAL